MTDKIVDETFKEVERMVYDFTHAATRIWKGMKFEEALSWAAEGYCQAYESYKPHMGAFTTWVGVKVKRRLLDYMRELGKQDSFTVLDIDLPFPEPTEFDLTGFLAKLGDDGRYVASLAMMPPMDVELLLRETGNPSNPDVMRWALREFLQEAGWAEQRIRQAFADIRSVL